MTETIHEVDVAVIGGGQAGLASGYFLTKRGYRPHRDFVIFDRSPRPGGAWQHVWRSVRLISPPHYTRLPGLPWERPFHGPPSGDEVADYLAHYEQHFQLPVLRPATVHQVTNDGPDPTITRTTPLLITTDQGTWRARAIINATGTWDAPFIPAVPGIGDFRGRQLHAAHYDTPHEFAGHRVIVVGGGHSALQILAELSTVADTLWVTRRPPEFRTTPLTEAELVGITRAVAAHAASGRPLRSVVSYTKLIETPEVAAARERGALNPRPMFHRITPHGVAWNDGTTEHADTILWATGFRPVLAHLAPLRLRSPHGGIALADTHATIDPRIHLVGYGPSASMISVHRAAATAARVLAASRPQPTT